MSIISAMRQKVSASLHDHLGKVSSATISSYFILGNILISSTVYMIIEIMNAHTMWAAGQIYSIPLEHIGIFSLVLTHHLILLGIKSSSSKSLFPNITKTIEEKHYTGVNISKKSEKSEVSEIEDEELESGEMEDLTPAKPTRKRRPRTEHIEDEEIFDADAAPMGARVTDAMDEEEEEEETPKPKRK